MEETIYEAIWSWIESDPELISGLIKSTRIVLKETQNRELTIFDSDKIASALTATIVAERLPLAILILNFPVVDFKYLRDGIKDIIQRALIEEFRNAANSN